MKPELRMKTLPTFGATILALAVSIPTSEAQNRQPTADGKPTHSAKAPKNSKDRVAACLFTARTQTKKAHGDGDHDEHGHDEPGKGAKSSAKKDKAPGSGGGDHAHDGDEKDHGHGDKKSGGKKSAKGDHPKNGKDDGHDGDGDHGAEGIVRLTAKQLAQTKIVSIAANPGVVSRGLPLTAEVSLNTNRHSQVGSSLPGRIVSIRVVAGQRVKEGERLAVLHSQELAGLTASYLAARERQRIAAVGYARERRLREKNISSEQALLAAQEKLNVAKITLQSIENKLHAVGLTNGDLEKLESDGGAHRYTIVAPITGTIVQRSVGLGERITPDKILFRVADLGTVWVIASVYQSDLAKVRVGQTAKIRIGAYKNRDFNGNVTWISDVLDEQTRTLKIRIKVDNKARLLKPGMFANVDVEISKARFDLVIPTSAIVRHRGETVVFVRTKAGEFSRREVTLGVRSETNAQVVRGLKAGECVVTEGVFTLKSELDKGAFKGGHAH